MRLFFSLILGLAAPLSLSAAGLEQRLGGADGWVTWQVPMVAGAGEPCCLEIRRGHVSKKGCDLDDRGWSLNSGDTATAGSAGMLALYAHVKGGSVDKLRAYAASCPVSSREALRELDSVDPAASVAWLDGQARRGDRTRKDSDDEAVAALAYHATPAALSALQGLADPARPREQREKALFWMGQARGAEGVTAVDTYARGDADAEIRSHAVFVLSQSPEHDTYPRVLAVAGSDRSAEVRGKALFWLAQMEDPRASADILAALRRDPDEDAREQAVFALSQLEDGAGDTALISVVRGDYPREVKQKALFWLGQSGSDTALGFLDEVLK